MSINILNEIILIRNILKNGCEQEITEEYFNDLSCKVFSYQFKNNIPYQKYCLSRNKTPDTINNYKDIPAVPTSAFKEVSLICFPESESINYFLTSGTTQGKQGKHCIRNYDLYYASLLPTFSYYVMPDTEKMEMVILSPSPDDQPHSSLITMFDAIRKSLGTEMSNYYMDNQEIKFNNLYERLEDIQNSHIPICLLGTSLSFRYLMEWCRQNDKIFKLPEGSRLMDTGGAKTKAKEIEREKLLGKYKDVFGIPSYAIINEFGMTEMFSQYYDSCFRMHTISLKLQQDVKMGPPWLRSLAVDPETLEPLPDGKIGLLRHYDLANVETVMAIQTEDIGIVRGRELVFLGRSIGALERGCSLTIEEIIKNQ